MLKILMPFLIIILLYRNLNVAGRIAMPTPPRVVTEQQIEHDISFFEIDGSRPFNPQVMSPSSISYTKIKGGWIDIEQLTSR